MTFTIGPRKLIEMIETTELNQRPDPGPSSCPRVPRTVRLKASRGILSVECRGQRRQEEVMVWADGQCRLARAELLQFLRRFQMESTVTVDVNCGLLRIRHLAVRLLGGVGAWTATSDVGECDFATD